MSNYYMDRYLDWLESTTPEERLAAARPVPGPSREEAAAEEDESWDLAAPALDRRLP
jgi:hypothetical protein